MPCRIWNGSVISTKSARAYCKAVIAFAHCFPPTIVLPRSLSYTGEFLLDNSTNMELRISQRGSACRARIDQNTRCNHDQRRSRRSQTTNNVLDYPCDIRHLGYWGMGLLLSRARRQRQTIEKYHGLSSAHEVQRASIRATMIFELRIRVRWPNVKTSFRAQ